MWWWNFYWDRRAWCVGYFRDTNGAAHVLHLLCLGFAWGRL